MKPGLAALLIGHHLVGGFLIGALYTALKDALSVGAAVSVDVA